MTVDKSFFVKSIQRKKEMIVAYCGYTNMPFVQCDPESYNDQVWIFDTEELLQEFARPFTEKKILLRGVKYLNKDFLGFFSLLHAIGVNELVFVSQTGRQFLDLDDLVKKPDYSKLPPEKQPIFNPQLQLTGLYFMQEMSRPVPLEEKSGLQEMEEELAANLVKSRYILPVELLPGPESDAEKFKNRKYRIPILKNKDGNVLQPLFTDMAELAKFNKGNQFKALVVPFGQLIRLLVKDSRGFVLNPAGFHIAMPKELLEGLQKRFRPEAAQQPQNTAETENKEES